jgi:hypothetical protein
MTYFRMARAVAFSCAASSVALGCFATMAEATSGFICFTYARATVKWGPCPGGGANNTLEDLEQSTVGLPSMTASVATAANQCAYAPVSPSQWPTPRPPAGFVYTQCGEAYATGSGNLESFTANVFTCLASHENYTSAEIRYTALRRHKGSGITNGQIQPFGYRARGDYTLKWFYSEYAGVFLPMDITENGIVDGHDLAQLLHNWGSTSSTTLADTNLDGIVDLTDLARLLAAWKTDGATP